MAAVPARRRPAAVAPLPWLALALLRIAGAERGFPLVPAMALAPQAAATSVVPLAAALGRRSRVGAVLAAAAGVGLALPVRAVRRPGTREAADERVPAARLRVATVSLRRGLVPAEPVLDLVRRHQVDVLSVQELTPAAERRLVAAGLLDLLPHAHVVPARRGSVVSASGAVWSRRPLHARGVVPGSFEQPSARPAVDRAPEVEGPEVEIVAVHTMPPAVSPAQVRAWSSDLAALPAPSPDVLRVLAGDFNATLDHAALRALLARGYRDAARAAGRGRAWTWRPLRAPFPRLALDHVLVDPRIGVGEVQVVAVRGSDHRAVVAELLLPAA